MTSDRSVPVYEERYVAFIDILGFSALVQRAEADRSLLERLVVSLQGMTDFQKLGPAMNLSAGENPTNFFHNMFRMSAFSDCVVFSTKHNTIGLGIVTTLSAIMCTQLLSQGIFTRGAICRGRLIHTDDVVLGQALIDAYRLESRAAVSPRVLLGDELTDELAALVTQNPTWDLRRIDTDGLRHLHILHKQITRLCAELSTKSGAGESFMMAGREQIARTLRDESDPAIRSKVGWLATYFNASVVDNDLAPLVLDGR